MRLVAIVALAVLVSAGAGRPQPMGDVIWPAPGQLKQERAR